MPTDLRPGRLIADRLAQDAAGPVPLHEVSPDIAIGDWGWLRTDAAGRTSISATAQPTQTMFPGPEWRRLNTPDRSGRTRLEALRFRARVLSRVRGFFDARGSLEVETPLRVPSPGVETHLSALGADVWYLSPAPEFQMKRLLAGGAGSI